MDLLFIPQVTAYTSTESHGGMIWTRETEELGENPVSVPLSPPQFAEPGANPGLRGERSFYKKACGK
jgi:hypothetical protein